MLVLQSWLYKPSLALTVLFYPKSLFDEIVSGESLPPESCRDESMRWNVVEKNKPAKLAKLGFSLTKQRLPPDM